MVWGHTWTERGKHVACWLDFPSRVYIDSNFLESSDSIQFYHWLVKGYYALTA
jgi:hypothetical protein